MTTEESNTPRRRNAPMSTYSFSSDDSPEHEQSRLRGGWSPERTIRRVSNGKGKEREEPRPNLQRKGGILRSRWLWYILPLVVAAIVIWAILHFSSRKIVPPDGKSPAWYPAPFGGTVPEWNESYTKASELVRNMSLLEKVNITTGTGWSTNLCVGNTGPATAAGFPMLCLQDGPLGIRFADNATLWPAGITAAATWNKDLIYRRGRGLGREHRLKGINVALGPSMGPLGRMPAGGRNWEGFGPDPVLAGIAASETIRGIQDEGVMATAKHLIGNEQEHFRQVGSEWGVKYAMSSNIDDRTLHELYLWPFQDSVKAGVASVMCSYNMVNSSYACQNSKLMNGILKDELGFQGFVQSDWLAQRSGVASALAGLDMSMPGDGANWADGDSFWGARLTQAVLNESVPIQRVDDMVTRIVASWYQLKQDNTTIWPPPPEGEDARPNFSSFTHAANGSLHPGTDDTQKVLVNQYIDVQGIDDEDTEKDHSKLAQEVAAEGHVLLKNENNILPINEHGLSNNAQPALGARIKIGIFGEDAGPVNNPKWPNQCEDRSCNDGTLAVGWGSGAAEFPFLITPLQALEKAFNTTTVALTTSLSNDPKFLPKDLGTYDLCLAFANSDSGEGFHTWEGLTDRKDLNLQKGGDKLLSSISSSCKSTVVIIHAVGPVTISSLTASKNVKAILLAHLPGENSGPALADILFGVRDASGRLPYTMGKTLKDYGQGGQIVRKPFPKEIPGQTFREGLLIDYRHFDHHDIEPLYPFGFGLSYTTWSLSNLTLTPLIPRDAEHALPSPRPDQPVVAPPSYSTQLPDVKDAYFPAGFRALKKYIYPYIPSPSSPPSSSLPAWEIIKEPYPYPRGYSTPHAPSPAGGAQGGHPDLFAPVLNISVTLTNTGSRKGKQVVQLYLSLPDNIVDVSTGEKIAMPKRVLRGFEKIELEAGEERVLEMQVERRGASYWSVGRGNWVLPTKEEGEIGVGVGFSSREVVLNGTW